MLCRLAMLMSLVFASAGWVAYANEVDIEAIKRAIAMDSAMTREDALKVARSEKALELTDLEDQSLTFMLFVFLASDEEKTQVDFRPLKEGKFTAASIAGEVARIRKGDLRRIPYEAMTCIHLDRITDCTCNFNGDIATGTVSFRAPGLYEGKARFVAMRHDGEWFICEFSMPSLNIDIVREKRERRDGDVEWDENVWRQRPAKR